MYQHPSYQRPTSLNNDIAVFELEKPIQFNKYVQPVCLPDKDVAVGSDCYITGMLNQNEIPIYLIVWLSVGRNLRRVKLFVGPTHALG